MGYSEQVKQAARNAADEIHQRGWGKGAFLKRDGSVCAVGAMRLACNGDPRDCSLSSLRLEQAFIDAGRLKGSISTWNDRKGRTKEEVLAVFDRIATS